VTVAYILEL
jgi:hypothetical protein